MGATAVGANLGTCAEGGNYIFASGSIASNAMPTETSMEENCLLQKKTYVKPSEGENIQKRNSVCFSPDLTNADIDNFCATLPGQSTCETERPPNYQIGGDSLPCVNVLASESELTAVRAMPQLQGRPGPPGVRSER